jgi:hypothetical protein
MTLAQFGRLAMKEEDALPVDQVVLLLHDAAVKENRIDAIKARLEGLLERRYGSAALTAGTVTFLDGDFIVTAEVPQEVTWDQSKLAKLAETIFHDWQKDLEDFINISYTVDEQTYLTWPPELRTHFDDARTVGVGKPTFTITAVKRAKRKRPAGKMGVA